MASEPDPEDITLFVNTVKNRQRIPRALARALQSTKEASQETTGRIFFDCGGLSTWAAYFLIKKSTKNTGHVPERGKKQRLISKLEKQPIEARRALARHVTIALEPDRTRIESILEAAILSARRSALRQSSIGSSSAADHHADTRDAPTPGSPAQAPHRRPRAASPAVRVELSPAPQAIDLRNSAQYFSEPGHALVHADISGCTRIFPPYFAGAIRRYPRPDNADVIAAAVSITLPRAGWTGCLMRVEVIGSKIGYIAQELFGVHLEAENGFRYIYLPGGSTAAPDPRFVLRNCRLDRLDNFFGARVADAIRTTPECQRDIKEGRDHASCVSMVVPSAVEDTGNIYALLCQSDAALLKQGLFS